MDFESVTYIWRMEVNYERNQYRFTTNDKNRYIKLSKKIILQVLRTPQKSCVHSLETVTESISFSYV